MARHTRAKPSFRLDLPDGQTVLLEGPCPDCAEHAKTCSCGKVADCDLCHGAGWVLTESGRSILAFVHAHAAEATA